jgi:hypothetical protein
MSLSRIGSSFRTLTHSPQYLVYCGWLVIELAFVIRYIVETRGRTLEETAALFDGEQPTADLVQMGGEAATTGMGRTLEQRSVPHDMEAEDKEQPTHAEYLGVQEMSVAGSSAESVQTPTEEWKDHRRLYWIDEGGSGV